jgi:hypothetical protein
MADQASRLLNPKAFLKNARRSKLQMSRRRGCVTVGPLFQIGSFMFTFSDIHVSLPSFLPSSLALVF